MAIKTHEEFFSPGVNSLKRHLNVRSVATSRYSSAELDASTFSDSQMSLSIAMSNAEQTTMTVSNFAIQDNGKILTCWCCSHVIPCLYEKEYTNAHGYIYPCSKKKQRNRT